MNDLAGRIDHSVLAPETSRADVHKAVGEAMQYGFASVCVGGCYVAEVAKALRAGPVKTCAVVGFPLGYQKGTIKAIEATSAVKDGADEIDFVAHLPNLLTSDHAAAKCEFIEIIKAARAANPGVIVKVIIESALLLGGGVSASEGEARIQAACRAARESGCDFVKTSTGFHRAGGASEQAIRLIKKHSGGLYVKASGGIRTPADARKMLDAGADRLGCSGGVEMIKTMSKTM